MITSSTTVQAWADEAGRIIEQLRNKQKCSGNFTLADRKKARHLARFYFDNS